MALRRYLIGEVAADFSDGLLTRREALRRLGLLGLSLTAGSALLAACGGDGGGNGESGDDGAAPGTSTTSEGRAGRGRPGQPATEAIRFRGPSGELQAAWSAPGEPRAGVLVVHENRGLTGHFRDLVGRLAGEGYAGLCVDLLSPEGGTGALADPAAAPAALAAAPLERLLGDLRAGIAELQRRVEGKKVGAVGFCFGGGLLWNLLSTGEERLAAAAPFYGPAPETSDFTRTRAAVLAVYAELDARVNASRERAESALRAAGRIHEVRTFAGADHAFFNETGPRYNEAAARQAYAALLEWFSRHLS